MHIKVMMLREPLAINLQRNREEQRDLETAPDFYNILFSLYDDFFSINSTKVFILGRDWKTHKITEQMVDFSS